MKKVLIIVTTIIMLFSFSKNVYADEVQNYEKKKKKTRYEVQQYNISGRITQTYLPSIQNVNGVEIKYDIHGTATSDLYGNITVDTIWATVYSVSIGYFGSGSYTYSVNPSSYNYYVSGNKVYLKVRSNIQVNGTTAWNESPLESYQSVLLIAA